MEAEGLGLLQGHWGDASVSRGGATDDEFRRLRNFAERDLVGVQPISYADLQSVLQKCPASAPGLDVLRYGHWASAGDGVARF